MSESTSSTRGPSEQISRDEMYSALFAHMIMQQSNMAMLLLGKVPHPESGKVMQDLDAAKLFIDQLEMLQEKTKGNLSKEEANLLKQSLMSLHMAFVDAANAAPSSSTQEAPEAKTEDSAPIPPASEESHKKFSKKY
jgi:Domain of unknown function (DUF1844)